MYSQTVFTLSSVRKIRVWAVTLLLGCNHYAFAVTNNIEPNQPPFAFTLSQVASWSPQLAAGENVSHIPLARRFSSPLDVSSVLDTNAKVLYAPDGMNNFGNYVNTQPKFNVYNFTHWSQIDLLNWFAGTADKTVQIPSRLWVETAHKNGVKVLGSVFLAVEKWGGNPKTLELLTEQTKEGKFIFADKLIAMAQYYGFDGWLINQETNLTAVKDENNNLVEGKHDFKKGEELATKLLQFNQYLTSMAPQGMEIHWYDSMISDGRVRWQNELNEKNERYLISNNGQYSADAIFINYDWTGDMVQSSRQRVEKLGLSRYQLYFGADLWPTRNAQKAFSNTKWLNSLFTANGEEAHSSIALFAPNINFNFSGTSEISAYSNFDKDPNDYRRFYETETRIFAGDDLNIAINDEISNPDAWVGIGQFLPPKSSIQALPFHSTFNVGQGKKWVSQGKKVSDEWSNIARQDILPTWQFAVQGNIKANIYYDFDEVYEGGSSLAVELTNVGQGQIPLYQTRLPVSASTALNITYRAPKKGIYVLLQTNKSLYRFPLKAEKYSKTGGKLNDWQHQSFSLAELQNEQLQRISLRIINDSPFNFHVGKIEVK